MPSIFTGIVKFSGWIAKNFDSIVAGIIASIIVILLQTFTRATALIIAAWANKSLLLSPVWGFTSSTRLYVVSGSIENVAQQVRNAILMGPDADAANEAITTTRLLRPKMRISRIYSPSYPDEFLKEDIVSVGGPVNNAVTRKLMAFISDFVIFEGFVLKDRIAGHDYETVYEADKVHHDYGLILKLPNPSGFPTEILILAGCDTHGVLAAARAVSLHPDGKTALKALRKRLGLFAHFRRNYYMAIVGCKAVGNEVGNLELIDFHSLRHITNILKKK